MLLTGLLLMSYMAPRQLLGAEDSVFSTLLELFADLLASHDSSEDMQGIVHCLTTCLVQLGKADVAAFRAERSVPRLAAQLARWLRSAPHLEIYVLSCQTELVTNLLVLHGGAWEALADAPDALQELIDSTVRPLPGGAAVPYQLNSRMLCCYVGKAALLSGATHIPTPLLRARRWWELIKASTEGGKNAAAAQQLISMVHAQPGLHGAAAAQRSREGG